MARDATSLIDRADRLGERVNGHPEHAREVVPELLSMLDGSEDARVVAAVISNLGRAWAPEACAAVVRFVGHPDDAVRLAVAQSAPCGADDSPARGLVADAMITLSSDRCDDVRDWATFALGSLLTVDGEEVRNALLARVDDAVDDVCDEALVGLARRRDRRVRDRLLARLGGERVGSLVFEAASYLADPVFAPALAEWSEALPDDDDIATALDACDPLAQQRRLDVHRTLLVAVQGALDEEHPGEVAHLVCDRFSDEVSLGLSCLDGAYLVPALLRRAGGDPQAAARVVAEDLSR